MALTKIEMQQLTDEFVQFQINEMTREEMASYVYNSMRQEIICQRTHLPLNESLKLQIDEYDCMTSYFLILETKKTLMKHYVSINTIFKKITFGSP